MSNRKPHNELAGYRASRRNEFSNGHVVIYDAKEANLDASEGRYVVSCEVHGEMIYTTSMPKARGLMKNPESFCCACRKTEERWDNFEPPTVNNEVY